MDLTSVIGENGLKQAGANLRLTRIAESSSFPVDVRYQAVKLVLAKAMQENNLE